MTKPTEKVVCTSCYRSFEEVPTTSFLSGSRTYKCPHCQAKVAYPMTASHSCLPWFIVVIGGIGVIWGLAAGQFILPGFLLLLGLWMLLHDAGVRRKVKQAEERAKDVDSQPPHS